MTFFILSNTFLDFIEELKLHVFRKKILDTLGDAFNSQTFIIQMLHNSFAYSQKYLLKNYDHWIEHITAGSDPFSQVSTDAAIGRKQTNFLFTP
jgi:hypothetical protein